jgi:hypothetical protein
MGKERINASMTALDMVVTMSEGNPGAINVVMTMLSNPDLAPFLLLCDTLGIRGSRLYMLHNDCCGRNNEKFKRTLTMIKRGVFTEEEINDCLNLPYALPFIDDSIVIDGVPPYGEAFDESHPKWREFCEKNRAAFLAKLSRTMSDFSPKM